VLGECAEAQARRCRQVTETNPFGEPLEPWSRDPWKGMPLSSHDTDDRGACAARLVDDSLFLFLRLVWTAASLLSAHDRRSEASYPLFVFIDRHVCEGPAKAVGTDQT
jgi:hypothetical protein